MQIGENIIWLFKIESTNDFTLNLIEREAVNDGTVVVAFEQTAGKGQRGSLWESEKGKNFTFSIVLYPMFLKPEDQFYLSMAVSLGICDYIRTMTSDVTIKWPNDIYIGNRKLGGTLIENSVLDNKIHHSVVGIGLNINQVEFSEITTNAVSMKMITGKEYDLEKELEIICQFLNARYNLLSENEFSYLENDYLLNMFGFDEIRKFKADNKIFDAKIIGISKYGELMLELPLGEIKHYRFKEVEYII
ncbi:MAG: biotin--[acetyl-CoA-carboxylase] ligase [Bacteroidia bacterium]|nr:biotin--[acetyl-CoA-carboxylase] ligase [Bacteroidia bacterium]